MNVDLQGIFVRFGAVQALNGVDVNLAPGRALVLMGPNGAGKSTLLGVLLGLVTPDAGRILVDGVVPDPMRLRERLGYLPEAVAFADNLTGRQVLRFFASARGVPRARVEAQLERVGLMAASGRAVRGYSRGMRQRLGLAVATLHDPDLLVLDEPTSGLDQEGLSLLWEVIGDARKSGKTIVIASHELALIERRADDLCVLRKGKVCAKGTPEALRLQAGLPVKVAVDVADSRAVSALVAALAAFGAVDVDGSRISAHVAPERLLEALRLVDRSAAIAHLRVEEPGLDDVYERLLEVA